MPSVAQGQSITLTANTIDGNGAPKNASVIVVDILDPTGAVLVNNAVPTNTGVGMYEYVYAVAADATVSAQWKARWDATMDGVAIGPIEEFFEVTATAEIGWISLADAKALTANNAITLLTLHAAAQEIYDEMRWTPEHGVDLTEENYAGVTEKADALGRAIAWQASYRQSTTASPSDGSAVMITSESFDAYSVSYGGLAGKSGVRSGGLIAERALKILRQHGLYNMSGISSDKPRYKYLVANAADVLSDP